MVLLLVALLLAAAPASAATVGREGTELVYRSAPGEKDDFVVQDADDVPGKVFFYESGRKITLGAGCVQGKLYPECSTEGVTAFRVFAADGKDKVRALLDLPVFVDLGTGDDDYAGRALVLTLAGGEGSDHVDAEVGGGTMDLGPGNDSGLVAIASVFTGPLSVAGGDGNDHLEVWGHAEPGITVSGGAGDDDIESHIYESTTPMDIACGPGNDTTRVRLADRLGEGCAPIVTGFNPARVARAFKAALTAPARVEVIFRRRPGNGRRPAEVLARGTAERPAGPLTLRLKTTKAGRRWLRGDLKLYVVLRTRSGGDRHEVRFDSRLVTAAAAGQPATVAREGTELIYRGSPGEDTVAFDGRRSTLSIGGVEGSKPQITPGTGCERAKRGVHCSLTGVTALRISSRGSDDMLSVRAPVPVFVDLGTGDDDIDGEAPSLTVTAGEGTDRVGFLAAAGAVDLGPGEDSFSAELPKGFTGPLTVDGGEGRDLLSLYGTVAPGVSFSGGPGDDELILQATGGPGVDVACGAGADRVELRIEDRAGEGCAAGFTPGTVSRTKFTGALTGPGTGKVSVIGGKRTLARGTFSLGAAGPLAVRLKATAAGRRSHRTKVFVMVRIRTGSDESDVSFPARLT